MSNIIIKIVFTLAAIGGIVLVFYVSWFWRLLLIPMIVIVLWDVASSFLRKKQKKGKS
jgi:hypothetical protein